MSHTYLISAISSPTALHEGPDSERQLTPCHGCWVRINIVVAGPGMAQEADITAAAAERAWVEAHARGVGVLNPAPGDTPPPAPPAAYAITAVSSPDAAATAMQHVLSDLRCCCPSALPCMLSWWQKQCRLSMM